MIQLTTLNHTENGDWHDTNKRKVIKRNKKMGKSQLPCVFTRQN